MKGSRFSMVREWVARPRARKLVLLGLVTLASIAFSVGLVLASNNVTGCDAYGTFGYGYGNSTGCDAYPATAHVEIANFNPAALSVTIGVGDPTNPLWSTSVANDAYSPDSFKATVDISGGAAYLPPNSGPVGADGYARNRWFVKVLDNNVKPLYSSYSVSGYISKFAINDSDSYYYADISGGYPVTGWRSTTIDYIDGPDSAAPDVYMAPYGDIYRSPSVIMLRAVDDRSGVDSASAHVYLDGTGFTCNTVYSATYSLDPYLTGSQNHGIYLSCPVPGLAYGNHSYSGTVADYAGNTAAFSASFNLLPDTTPPVVSNVAPSGTVSYGPVTLSADYSDAESGINWSSAGLYLDGFPLYNCSISSTHISCNTYVQTGTHRITGSVADMAGNTADIKGSFNAADTAPPYISSIIPSGSIYSTSAAIGVYYGDPGSGINSASAQVYLDGARLTGCTATMGYISCPVSGLSYSTHIISGSVADNAGNVQPFSSGFKVAVDTIPPNFNGMGPQGTVYGGMNQIYASYNDPQTGIDAASVAVYMDGNRLNNCTVDAGHATCPVWVTTGAHDYVVKVADNSGNMATGGGSFFYRGVGNGKPSLQLSRYGAAFWASYQDYLAHRLSVNFVIFNQGPGFAYDVRITGSTNTNGVSMEIPYLTLFGADLSTGSQLNLTLAYDIPTGVAGWQTSIRASARDGLGILYAYP